MLTWAKKTNALYKWIMGTGNFLVVVLKYITSLMAAMYMYLFISSCLLQWSGGNTSTPIVYLAKLLPSSQCGQSNRLKNDYTADPGYQIMALLCRSTVTRRGSTVEESEAGWGWPTSTWLTYSVSILLTSVWICLRILIRYNRCIFRLYINRTQWKWIIEW